MLFVLASSVVVLEDFEGGAPPNAFYGPDAYVSASIDSNVKFSGFRSLKLSFILKSPEYSRNWMSVPVHFKDKVDFSQYRYFLIAVKGCASPLILKLSLIDSQNRKYPISLETVLQGSSWRLVKISLTDLPYVTPEGAQNPQRKFDFSSVVGVDIVVVNGRQFPHLFPVTGTVYIDRLALAEKRISPGTNETVSMGMSNPSVPHLVFGVTYYSDEELDKFYEYPYYVVFYNKLDELFYLKKNVMLYLSLGLPLLYRVKGTGFNWVPYEFRGDSLIYALPWSTADRSVPSKMALSIDKIVLAFEKPLLWMNKWKVGSLWIDWSDMSVFEASRNWGIYGESVSANKEISTFLAGDPFARNKFFFGIRALSGSSNFKAGASAIVGTGVQPYPVRDTSGSLLYTGIWRFIGDFEVAHVFFDFHGLSDFSLESGVFRENMVAITSIDSMKARAYISGFYEEPQETLDVAFRARLFKKDLLGESKPGSLYIGLEGYYWGPRYGGSEYFEGMLPWIAGIDLVPPRKFLSENFKSRGMANRWRYFDFVDGGFRGHYGAIFEFRGDIPRDVLSFLPEKKGLPGLYIRFWGQTRYMKTIRTGADGFESMANFEFSLGPVKPSLGYLLRSVKGEISESFIEAGLSGLVGLAYLHGAAEYWFLSPLPKYSFLVEVVAPLGMMGMKLSLRWKYTTPSYVYEDLGGLLSVTRMGIAQEYIQYGPDNYIEVTISGEL